MRLKKRLLIFLLLLLATLSFLLSKLLGLEKSPQSSQAPLVKNGEDAGSGEEGKNIRCQISKDPINISPALQNEDEQADCTFISCNLFEFF